MSKDKETQADYLFAQGIDETRRLKRQADFLSRFTHSLLDAAGITSGMKVLDVGTGIGNVAFMVAERVGPQGTVVGVDMNPAGKYTLGSGEKRRASMIILRIIVLITFRQRV